MIDYIEVRNSSRAVVGIVDTAKSVIWHSQYYGVGDFEIYAPATPGIINLLKENNYVTRTNDANVGIIERVEISYNPSDGQMIVASGRFAKSMLYRRLIYNISGNTIYPVVSSGNVEAAARALVTANIISATDTARNVSFFELGASAGITKTIVDANGNATSKQTSFDNLGEYTDAMLQEYNLGAYVALNSATSKLQYKVFEGEDRSAGNTDGNEPLVFSQDFDNLLASAYLFDNSAVRNTALIGGEGEGTARFATMLTSSATGINRREIFIDGSGQSKKYQDANAVEHEYTDTEYTALLRSQASQEMAAFIITETLGGEIDISNSGLTLGTDYGLGDLVTLQDNLINVYTTARIIGITEVQDDGGYTIAVEFGE